MKPGPRHQCMIYAGAPSEKLTTLAVTMRQMTEKGYRCLYMNSPTMVAGMRSYLSAMGADIGLELSEGRLMLSSEPVCEGENFNIDQMLQKLEDTLDGALNNGYTGLWVSGDMTWEFGSEKNFEKLLEYEWKLEMLFQKRKELHGICQYHHDTLPQQILQHALVSHRMIFINDTLSRLNPHYHDSGLPSEKITDHQALDNMIKELCRADPGRP